MEAETTEMTSVVTGKKMIGFELQKFEEFIMVLLLLLVPQLLLPTFLLCMKFPWPKESTFCKYGHHPSFRLFQDVSMNLVV
jgi:hypothetical protein